MSSNALRLFALVLCLSSFVVDVSAQDAAQHDSQIDEHGRWENAVTEPWFFYSEDKYTPEEIVTAKKIWNAIANSAENLISYLLHHVGHFLPTLLEPLVKFVLQLPQHSSVGTWMVDQLLQLFHHKDV